MKTEVFVIRVEEKKTVFDYNWREKNGFLWVKQDGRKLKKRFRLTDKGEWEMIKILIYQWILLEQKESCSECCEEGENWNKNVEKE